MKKLLSMALALCLAAGCLLAFASCKDKNTLVVYTEAGFAPFEYESDGKIVGVDVDIMELVGKKLGKTVKFENVAFDTIVDAVSAGKLTNVGAAGISVTDERKEKVNFSKEYYQAKLYVIYLAEDAATYESETTDGVTGVYWDSLKGKTIAVQGGTTADLFLGDNTGDTPSGELGDGVLAGSGAKKSSFTSLATAVEDVQKKTESNVLIIDELPAKELIKGKSNLKCAPLYYQGGENENDEAATDSYAICVTKGQDELLKAINEVLEELGDEGIQALVNKHLGV